jgi:hypothetical protein
MVYTTPIFSFKLSNIQWKGIPGPEAVEVEVLLVDVVVDVVAVVAVEEDDELDEEAEPGRHYDETINTMSNSVDLHHT